MGFVVFARTSFMSSACCAGSTTSRLDQRGHELRLLLVLRNLLLIPRLEDAQVLARVGTAEVIRGKVVQKMLRSPRPLSC